MRLLKLAIIAAAAAALDLSPISAQELMAPIAVALVDELPLDSRATGVVLRRFAGEHPDIILLTRRTANPRALDGAVRTLLDARIRGLSPENSGGQTVSLVIEDPKPAGEEWEARHAPRLNLILDRLRREAPVVVEGVGEVPLVAFYPPRLPPRGT